MSVRSHTGVLPGSIPAVHSSSGRQERCPIQEKVARALWAVCIRCRWIPLLLCYLHNTLGGTGMSNYPQSFGDMYTVSRAIDTASPSTTLCCTGIEAPHSEAIIAVFCTFDVQIGREKTI